MRSFDTLAQLAACVGEEVAVSDWHTVTQHHIDLFAEATGDHQWIHVDPERARAGPFGTTIAHGFLTLALIAGMADRTLQVRDQRMGINYGLNKVRFIAPVRAGSRVRTHMELLEATPIEGGVQMVWRNTIEIEGSDKPACVAESVARYYT